MTSAHIRVYDNNGLGVNLVRNDEANETVLISSLIKRRVSTTYGVVVVSGTIKRTGLNYTKVSGVWARLGDKDSGSATTDLFSQNAADLLPWVEEVKYAVLSLVDGQAREFLTTANDDRLHGQIVKNREKKARQRDAALRATLYAAPQPTQDDLAAERATLAAERASVAAERASVAAERERLSAASALLTAALALINA